MSDKEATKYFVFIFFVYLLGKIFQNWLEDINWILGIILFIGIAVGMLFLWKKIADYIDKD